MARKVIITCAVTGSIHTPSMSPHLPVTAAEIAQSALGAAEAGAAIVHLTPAIRRDGRPDQSPEAFEPFLRVIKQFLRCGDQSNHRRLALYARRGAGPPGGGWKPEVASLNMGSMNFGLFPMLKRFTEFRHAWEPAMLEGQHDLVFRNSFKDIRYALETLNDTGARYEFECYDTSHLHNLHYFWKEGLVKAPLFIQTCFGLLGGIRCASRGGAAHEAHRRSAVRRRLSLVGARRGPHINARRRRRPRWVAMSGSGWRIALARRRQARAIQCRAGDAGPTDHRRAGPGDRDTPTRRARSCSSRAATRSRSNSRRA